MQQHILKDGLLQSHIGVSLTSDRVSGIYAQMVRRESPKTRHKVTASFRVIEKPCTAPSIQRGVEFVGERLETHRTESDCP